MSIARFQMPNGRIARFEVPDGTSPEQAQALIAQSLEPQANVQVSSPEGQPLTNQFGETGGGAAVGRPQGIDRTNIQPEPRPLESALAGATKSFVDPAVAAAQLATGGNLGTSQFAKNLAQQASQYQEANPASYLGGRIAGTALPAAGMAKGIGMIPSFAKASSLKTATPYLQGAAIGGVSGALTPEETGKIDQGLYGEQLKQMGIGAALGAPLALLGGAAHTIEKAGKAVIEPFSKGGQNEILGRALRQFSGNDAETAIRNLRAAKEGVSGSMPTVGEAAGVPSLAAAQRAAMATSPEATNALANRQMMQGQARTAALQGIAPESRVAKYADLRERVANDLYENALSVKMNIPVEMEKDVAELIKTPAIKSAMEQARINALNKGYDIANPTGSMRGLHETKMALDDQIARLNVPNASSAEKAKMGGLIASKDRLLGFIEEINPAYKKASSVYARLSKPVNQLESIESIAGKSVSPASETIYPVKFASELAKIEKEGILSAQQISRLKAINEDVQRSVFAQKAGRDVGSDTMQKLAYGNMLNQINLPTLLRRHGLSATVGNIAARGSDVGYGRANKELAVKLSEALLDPQKAAALMKLAGKDIKASVVSPEQANLAKLLVLRNAQNAIKGVSNE